jgi:hypothetical protein
MKHVIIVEPIAEQTFNNYRASHRARESVRTIP